MCLIQWPVTFDWTESLFEAAIDACIRSFVPIRAGRVKADNASAARNEIHEAFESRLYGVQIFINIGVVELNRSKNHGIRKVVQKLRTFIEEGGIVFVALQNKMFAVAEPEATAEIFRDAANQK